jgi:hypothetical protein
LLDDILDYPARYGVPVESRSAAGDTGTVHHGPEGTA